LLWPNHFAHVKAKFDFLGSPATAGEALEIQLRVDFFAGERRLKMLRQPRLSCV